MMPSIMSGSLIRETPPWARMSAGTRSSAITATAPASSAILACSAVTTSMMTPPLSISAMPRLTRAGAYGVLAGMTPDSTGRTRPSTAARSGHDRRPNEPGGLAGQPETGDRRCGSGPPRCCPGIERQRLAGARPAGSSRPTGMARDQVPLMRLPWRKTETGPCPDRVGELDGLPLTSVSGGCDTTRHYCTITFVAVTGWPSAASWRDAVDVADVLLQRRAPSGTRPGCRWSYEPVTVVRTSVPLARGQPASARVGTSSRWSCGRGVLHLLGDLGQVEDEVDVVRCRRRAARE